MTAAVERASSATLGRMAIGPLDLEVLRRGPPARRRCCWSTGSTRSARRRRFSICSREHGEVIAPSHPGFRQLAAARTISTRCTTWFISISTCSTRCRPTVTLIGFSFGGWIAAEVAASGHPQARQAGAGRSGRHQARRARGARHRAFLQYLPRRAEPARLARPGQAPDRHLRPRLAGSDRRRDERRRHGHARAQLGFAVPLCLAAAYVQPAAQALAAPHRGADAGAVGRQRRHRHARITGALCRA